MQEHLSSSYGDGCHDANFCLDDVGIIEVGKKPTVKGGGGGIQLDFLIGVTTMANKLATVEGDNLFDKFTLDAASMYTLVVMLSNQGKCRPVAMSGILLQRSIAE